MVKQVRLNKTYNFQGALVVVVKTNQSPRVPATVTIRHVDGRTQDVLHLSFRTAAVAVNL